MLKIQKSMDAEGVRFRLSGRIEPPHLVELEALIAEAAGGPQVVLDLEEVRLVDRAAVTFLARCEASGIRLENGPAYVREWIARERDEPGEPSRPKRR